MDQRPCLPAVSPMYVFWGPTKEHIINPCRNLGWMLSTMRSEEMLSGGTPLPGSRGWDRDSNLLEQVHFLTDLKELDCFLCRRRGALGHMLQEDKRAPSVFLGGGCSSGREKGCGLRYQGPTQGMENVPCLKFFFLNHRRRWEDGPKYPRKQAVSLQREIQSTPLSFNQMDLTCRQRLLPF